MENNTEIIAKIATSNDDRLQQAKTYLALGNTKYNNREYKEAYEAYNLAIGLNPDLMEAWFGRSSANSELGHKTEALKDHNQGMKLNQARIARENIKSSSEEFNIEDLGWLEDYLSEDIESFVISGTRNIIESILVEVDNLFYDSFLKKFSAQYQFALGDLDEAIQLLEPIFKQILIYEASLTNVSDNSHQNKPSNIIKEKLIILLKQREAISKIMGESLSTRMLINSQFANQEYGKVIQNLNDFLKDNPVNADIFFLRAEAKKSQAQQESSRLGESGKAEISSTKMTIAENFFQRLLEKKYPIKQNQFYILNTKFVTDFFQCGSRENALISAIADYDQAIELQSKAIINYEIMFDTNDISKAWEYYKNVICFSLDTANMLFRRGITKQALGQHTEAKNDYEQILQLQKTLLLLNKLLGLYFFEEIPNNTETHLPATLPYTENHSIHLTLLHLIIANSYFCLGLANEANNNHTDAIACYKKAILFNSDYKYHINIHNETEIFFSYGNVNQIMRNQKTNSYGMISNDLNVTSERKRQAPESPSNLDDNAALLSKKQKTLPKNLENLIKLGLITSQDKDHINTLKKINLPDGRTILILQEESNIDTNNCGFNELLGNISLGMHEHVSSRKAIISLIKDHLKDPQIMKLISQDINDTYPAYIYKSLSEESDNLLPQDIKDNFVSFKRRLDKCESNDAAKQAGILKELENYCNDPKTVINYLENYLIHNQVWPQIRGSLAAFAHIFNIKIHCLQIQPNDTIIYNDKASTKHPYDSEVFILQNKEGDVFTKLLVKIEDNLAPSVVFK